MIITYLTSLEIRDKNIKSEYKLLVGFYYIRIYSLNENSGTVYVKQGRNPKNLYEHQLEAQKKLNEINKKEVFSTLIVLPTGERVIIVMGAINDFKSRVSGTFIKYNSCTAYSN